MELSYKNNYEFQAEEGSKVELEIEAKIKEVSSTDLEEILHEVASCTHSFYLGLGRKISEEMKAQYQKNKAYAEDITSGTFVDGHQFTADCSEEGMGEVKKTGLSMEVYRHFGLDLFEMRDKGQEQEWGICKKEDAQRCTRNMLGFGMEQSQQIIIDFDKDYNWVLVRRVKKCGDTNTPPRN